MGDTPASRSLHVFDNHGEGRGYRRHGTGVHAVCSLSRSIMYDNAVVMVGDRVEPCHVL